MKLNILHSLLLALLLFGSARAQESFRYVHVSTNPSYAEAYTNTIRRDFAQNPDYNLPDYIPVPAGEASVLVTIFKPGYRDTTINVTLSEADTSYIIVSLTPSYDDAYLSFQQDELSHRTRKNLGRKLMLVSALPLLASGVAAIVTQYNISEARDYREKTEKSLIREGDEYAASLENFESYRDKAKTSKGVTLATLIAGASLLTFGIILSF